ncbi:hypothetical protein DFH08DRAFT_805341 [Mycena albidolilacea]|uniref:Uncharacterized protein n=1 Tax=Mycena albidolilacea TaxID=1033008 RepID=A0AAD7A8G3_9AGAR|nr:hypothetical protein DFH08DRAFT_805341 [Mycena albidolilacea]
MTDCSEWENAPADLNQRVGWSFGGRTCPPGHPRRENVGVGVQRGKNWATYSHTIEQQTRPPGVNTRLAINGRTHPRVVAYAGFPEFRVKYDLDQVRISYVIHLRWRNRDKRPARWRGRRSNQDPAQRGGGEAPAGPRAEFRCRLNLPRLMKIAGMLVQEGQRWYGVQRQLQGGAGQAGVDYPSARRTWASKALYVNLAVYPEVEVRWVGWAGVIPACHSGLLTLFGILRAAGIVTVRPGRRTASKTAVQWTVRRRYGGTTSLATLDGTGRWTGRPSTVDGRHIIPLTVAVKELMRLVRASNIARSRGSKTAEPQRDVTWQSVAAVHPSVIRRPVDGTPVFTTVRRRDGCPSVRPPNCPGRLYTSALYSLSVPLPFTTPNDPKASISCSPKDINKTRLYPTGFRSTLVLKNSRICQHLELEDLNPLISSGFALEVAISLFLFHAGFIFLAPLFA